jgi:hypothetical protein
VRAEIWHLFACSAWAQQNTVGRSRQVRALRWPLFAWSAWAQPEIVVACTKVEGADLASVCSIGVG